MTVLRACAGTIIIEVTIAAANNAFFMFTSISYYLI